MAKSRRSVILEGLNADKSTDDIVAEVIEAFPDTDVKKARNQVFVNKSIIAKSKQEGALDE